MAHPNGRENEGRWVIWLSITGSFMQLTRSPTHQGLRWKWRCHALGRSRALNHLCPRYHCSSRRQTHRESPESRGSNVNTAWYKITLHNTNMVSCWDIVLCHFLFHFLCYWLKYLWCEQGASHCIDLRKRKFIQSLSNPNIAWICIHITDFNSHSVMGTCPWPVLVSAVGGSMPLLESTWVQ